MPWLMKAEPDSRIVKGKDVKFSVDDFEKIGTSPWDGVRSYEAKSIMKEKMKIGDKVLFYHSNCKEPGVFALAEVAKEGYPDYTAWDEYVPFSRMSVGALLPLRSHPYFDAKTDKANPTWFMVDVKFTKRVDYPPTLALMKFLAGQSSLPTEVEYIGQEGLVAIRNMALVNRGRLSVQPVGDEAYQAVVKLGTEGGWEGLVPKKEKKKASTKEDEGKVPHGGTAAKGAPPGKHTKRKSETGAEENGRIPRNEAPQQKQTKRKSVTEATEDGRRRSNRTKV